MDKSYKYRTIDKLYKIFRQVKGIVIQNFQFLLATRIPWERDESFEIFQ